MKIILKNFNSQKFISETYRNDVKLCLKYPEDTRTAKENFLKLEALCRQTNQNDVFCINAEKFATHLQKSGKIKLANIIYGELGKIYGAIGKTELAEECIEKSIEICNCLDDKIHILARLTDLEIIFKQVRNGKKLYSTLIRKIECAKAILQDYEHYSKTFNTISKKPLSPESIKVQMAYAYSDLADIIKHKRPNHSIKLLKKAQDIYIELNRKKEVNYLEKKIEYVKKNYINEH